MVSVATAFLAITGRARLAAALVAADPPADLLRRAKIVLGLLLITLGGLCALALLLVIGRWVRRSIAKPLARVGGDNDSRAAYDEDDWARKPLVTPPPGPERRQGPPAEHL